MTDFWQSASFRKITFGWVVIATILTYVLSMAEAFPVLRAWTILGLFAIPPIIVMLGKVADELL